ncbi:FkbM family methyltransferase [Candidatus Pelagibacter bacterium]|nr:FkbM family methyltransferase [Candidatus Pelagibacter bacterium]
MSKTKEFAYRGVKIQISERNHIHHKNKPVSERLRDGSYEKGEITLMLSKLDPNAIVLELGSSLGVLACIVGKNLADSSKMVCVEANPNLLEDLRNNRDINDLKFQVIHGAASSKNYTVDFNFNGLTLGGSIMRKKWLEGDKWGKYDSVTLETITPIDIENKTELKFDTLSCDIEGEELKMLPDMIEYFKNYKLLVIEFHDWAEKSSRYQHSIRQVHEMYSKYFKIKKFGCVTCFYK